MPHAYHEIAFTPTVKARQESAGSRRTYARFEAAPQTLGARLTAAEREFFAARDSVYIASVSETGWPYVQHRGGPPGFIRVLDDATLGFADYAGNRQYVSVGNLSADDRIALIAVDYAERRRLKLFGRARSVDLKADPGIAARLVDQAYGATVERALLIEVAGFDWNCPQHITPRFTEAEVVAGVAPLQAELRALRAEVAALRAQVAAAGEPG